MSDFFFPNLTSIIYYYSSIIYYCSQNLKGKKRERSPLTAEEVENLAKAQEVKRQALKKPDPPERTKRQIAADKKKEAADLKKWRAAEAGPSMPPGSQQV